MKNNIITLATAAILGLAFTTTNNVALAETVVKETTTTNTAGTISEFGTDTIIVRSATSPTPIRYSYSKTTTYVDESGKAVSIETVKSGLPVTVYYTKDGDRMIATKVIVRNAAPANVPEVETKKTTTTTTTTNTAGTISEFGADTIVVRSETATAPLRYSYSKRTTYVNEAGEPVSIETVKSGLPVTVYYTKDGDKMIATKVIVRTAVVK